MNGQPNAALAEVEKHIPRAYQDEIFAKARYTNIIAALDTGSGKTLISTLLIKSICARTTSIGKKIIFLVPKVPLVEQQKTFIEDQTPLRVKGYYGAMNVDAWNMSQWHSEFDKADVLVMTAQIFLNILTHAFWKLENVSLIIFDECHHAQRNHPYNTIMCDFYRQCPQEHRPQVFGMTASPIWNLKKPRESLRQLETNLFSTVLAVKEHTDELTKHSPKPTEIVKFYRRSPISYPSYMSPSLWDRIQSDTAISSTFVASARSRYEVSLSAIGPYGADKYLYDYLKWKLQALVDVEHEEMLKVPTIIPQPEQSVNTVESAEPLIDRPSADWLRTVLLEFDQYLLVDCAIQTGWLSPKLIAIVELLKKYKSSSFQGILFVEQRQVAMVLSWLLPRLPELNGWLRCDDLVGHGEDEVVKGMNRKSQKEIVHSFREKHFNLLVATSVAEEGLDFPACELVIRYDTIKHMVGYLQSRGRARHQASTYVVMIEEDNQAEITRYENFRRSEPELRTIYQNGDEKVVSEDMGDDEPDNPDDLAERELYIIPSTGATLSYGSSISLLNHLCSLIPRDKFTSVLKPKYVGDFVVTVELPSALPLGKEQRIYQGLPKRTKKEAKRVAAFIAARALHRLGVFDDNLSPIKATSGDKIEDADGHLIPDISEIPEMILTNVRDPWSCAWDLWLHVISIQPDGSPSAGLITGSRLPSLDLNANGLTVTLRDAFLVQTAYDESEKREQLHLMEAFMKVGLEWCVTRSPISAPLSCYLVPIDEVNMQPDWETMKKAVAHPRGNYDWNNIKDGYEDDLLLMNSKKTGHTLILHRIRHDLTSQSRPEADSDIDATLFPTYGDYFFKKYSSSKVAVELPVEGPLLEVCSFQRNRSARYLPESISPREFSPPATVPSFFVPRIFCKWLYFPRKLFETYRILPQLCHRVTDVYRVRCACRELKLSLSLANDFLVEAFTLPCANAGFNNQRLETLGDSVLKLCVVVHIYNQFPSKHEGQLDSIKKNCISNRVLCTRGYAVGLQQFLTSEIQDLKSWRYVTETDDTISSSLNFVPRIIPRRSLQDCMEASLGASYLTGKIELALHTGTALNLSFGGTRAWKDRYMRLPVSPVPPLFKNLEVSLGYTFHNGGLLLEALTHPSYDSSAVSCYQRLEFLGDAVLELAITEHLFSKFPQAKSGRLSMTRAKAVCGPTLAAVAVKEFKLHKYILTNNVALDKAVTQEISALESTEYEQFLRKGWQYDPPKVLSDVLESLMGAVLVDSGYDYLMTFSLIKKAMCSVLEILTVDLPLDPVSELMIWTAKAGCRRIHFRKFRSSEMLRHCDSYSVLVHDRSVAESGAAPNLSLAKGLAATQALAKLSDSTSDLALSMICNCLQLENTAVSEDQVEAEIISDETDDGYAHIAYSHLQNSTGIVDGLETDVFGDITEENQ